jgi:hypothetical protein
MTNFQRTGTERSPGADPEVTALLRAAYAAPQGDDYWQSFEKRVMSRINESTPAAWWTVFSEWREAGAIAATVALLLAGYTVVRDMQAADSARTVAVSSEFYTIFDDASGDVSVALTEPTEEGTSDEAAERYLDSFYP